MSAAKQVTASFVREGEVRVRAISLLGPE